jgi:hypothetical protein
MVEITIEADKVSSMIEASEQIVKSETSETN